MRQSKNNMFGVFGSANSADGAGAGGTGLGSGVFGGGGNNVGGFGVFGGAGGGATGGSTSGTGVFGGGTGTTGIFSGGSGTTGMSSPGSGTTGIFSGGGGATGMFSGGSSSGTGVSSTGMFSGGASFSTPANTFGGFTNGGFQGTPTSTAGSGSFMNFQGFGAQSDHTASKQAAKSMSNKQTQQMESLILAAVTKAFDGIMGTNQNSDDDEDPDEKEELDKLPNSIAAEIRAKRKAAKKQESRDGKQLVINGLEDRRRDAILSAVKQSVAHGVIVVQPDLEEAAKQTSEQKDKEQTNAPENLWHRDQVLTISRSTAPDSTSGSGVVWKELLADLSQKAKDSINPLKEIDEHHQQLQAIKRLKDKQNRVQLEKLKEDESQSTLVSEADEARCEVSNQARPLTQPSKNPIDDDNDDWRSLLKKQFPPHRNIPIWIDYSGKICSKFITTRKRVEAFSNFEELRADLLATELGFLNKLPQFASAYFWRRVFQNELPVWYRLPLITPINLDQMADGDIVLRIESQDRVAGVLEKYRAKSKKSDPNHPFKVSPLLLTGELKIFSKQQIKESEKLLIDPPIELLKFLLDKKQEETAKPFKRMLPENGCPTYKMGFLYDLKLSVSHLVLKNIWGRVEFKKIMHLTEADLESLPNSVLISGTEIRVTDPDYQVLNPHIKQLACWNSVPSWYIPPSDPKSHQHRTSMLASPANSSYNRQPSSSRQSLFPGESSYGGSLLSPNSSNRHTLLSSRDYHHQQGSPSGQGQHRSPNSSSYTNTFNKDNKPGCYTSSLTKDNTKAENSSNNETGRSTPTKDRTEHNDTHFETPDRRHNSNDEKTGATDTPSTAHASRRLESPGIDV